MKENNYINRIILGDSTAFEEMYKELKPQFIALFRKHHGVSVVDAEDLYHKACVILYNNIETRRLERDSLSDRQLKTYIDNTGKYILFNERRKRQVPLIADTDMLARHENPDDAVYDKEYDDKLFIIRTAVRDMPMPCSQILNMAIYQKKSHHEIAETMHYANEDTVKAQRWRCMKKLKEIVMERFKVAGYEE